jgi:Cu2+-containing amine oxidase
MPSHLPASACCQVEMAVPYSDPNAPYTRKCAFDVGGG